MNINILSRKMVMDKLLDTIQHIFLPRKCDQTVIYSKDQRHLFPVILISPNQKHHLSQLFSNLSKQASEVQHTCSPTVLFIVSIIATMASSCCSKVLFTCDSCENKRGDVNPLHLCVSMHILHTVLYTFSKVRIRRICLTIKSLFSKRSFPLFS